MGKLLKMCLPISQQEIVYSVGSLDTVCVGRF